MRTENGIDGYLVHGSQTLNYLNQNDTFEFYIDYFSDDAEAIRLRDGVTISIDEIEPLEDHHFVSGAVVDGPSGLLGKPCVLIMNFETYKGMCVFHPKADQAATAAELPSTDTDTEAGDQTSQP
jgi:hypothetical protein